MALKIYSLVGYIILNLLWLFNYFIPFNLSNGVSLKSCRPFCFHQLTVLFAGRARAAESGNRPDQGGPDPGEQELPQETGAPDARCH